MARERQAADFDRFIASVRMEHEAEVAALRAKWEADIDILNALNKRLDDVAELLHRQRVLHANLVAPTHPNAPVLIQVDQVLALIEEAGRG